MYRAADIPGETEAGECEYLIGPLGQIERQLAWVACDGVAVEAAAQ
jgi:hypothetical protein